MALEPIGGGSSGGPGDVKLTGSEPSLLVQSGTKAVAATTVYATELQYGIDFQVTIPNTEFQGVGAQNSAQLYASYIQAIGMHDSVAGISYGQDVNAAGNLVDTLFVTVADPTGEFTTTTQVPLRNANTPGAFGIIQKATDAVNRAATGA